MGQEVVEAWATIEKLQIAFMNSEHNSLFFFSFSLPQSTGDKKLRE